MNTIKHIDHLVNEASPELIKALKSLHEYLQTFETISHTEQFYMYKTE